MSNPDMHSNLWKDPFAKALMAAWVGVPVDKLPPDMAAHTCHNTAKGWKRVADAARAELLGGHNG